MKIFTIIALFMAAPALAFAGGNCGDGGSCEGKDKDKEQSVLMLGSCCGAKKDKDKEKDKEEEKSVLNLGSSCGGGSCEGKDKDKDKE